ncbi:MAG TPA: GNAT family N-acetyltransferase [Anaerolineaceae bacterium]|nr:GNAT family N-acetyltransferase [Anaerolineaceae bacterium]
MNRILDIQFPVPFIARPAVLDDAEKATDLFNAISHLLIGANEAIAESVRYYWQTPGFNLETDVLVVFTPDGRLIGEAEFWDTGEPHVHYHGETYVHPDFVNQGLEIALIAWTEARARRSVGKAPAEALVKIAQGTYDQDHVLKTILQSQGYQYERSFYQMRIEGLTTPPPAPILPDGLIIRAMNPDTEFDAVVDAVADSFQDHWGFVPQPRDERLAQWRHRAAHNPRYDPSLWFVAMDGQEIAAIALCYASTDEDAEMGWVQTLGVRRPWRKQGLGLALLHHAFGELYRRGRHAVGLGVDASSLTGATRLYERAGMRVVRQFNSYAKVLRPGIELGTETVTVE